MHVCVLKSKEEKRAVGEAVKENHDDCMLACFHLRFSSVCVSVSFLSMADLLLLMLAKYSWMRT